MMQTGKKGKGEREKEEEEEEERVIHKNMCNDVMLILKSHGNCVL
jgi:hypothetical protein